MSAATPRVPPAPPAGSAAPGEGWVASEPRHELKYAGPAGRAGAAEALLGRLCPADRQHPENTVHSVYFDSSRLASYHDKANGQYVKEKLRLRWYEPGPGEPDAAPRVGWLEIKARVGTRGFKWRKAVALPAPGPAGPDQPDEGALVALVGRHLGAVYRPAVWLAYRRRRFVVPDGSARVSLDRDLCLRWAARALAPHRPPGLLPWFVVEVKGERPEPPAWLSRAIGRFARSSAFSKYGLCVEHARGGFS
jgi:hypothetical protein